MEIQEMLLDPNPYSRTGEEQGEIQNIVVHWVGNANTSAKANRDYFNNLQYTHATYASSHYIIGLQGEIIRCIPDDEVAFHAGDRNMNRHSIGIENCHPDWGGKFNNYTYNSLVELVVELCKTYGLNEGDVIRHYDVTGKDCPHYYVQNQSAWDQFRADVANGLRVPDLRYKSHIQDFGWTEWQDAGTVEGTVGECKRLEAVIFETSNDLQISYRAHCQNIGWQDWKNSGEVAGTTGQSLRLEALEIKSNKLLEAQEHLEDVGWMPVSTGTDILIGTIGKSLRLEAFRIIVK